MSTSHITEMQAAVQTASDQLADALLAGTDTSEARAALDQARAALQKHQEAVQAADSARQQAEAEVTNAALRVAEDEAMANAAKVVVDAVDSIQLPQGVEPPLLEYPAVTKAAAEIARLKLSIENGQPEREQMQAEIDALNSRVGAKRAQAAAIRTRRQAGHEKASDAVDLHLLEADADDLNSLAQAAKQRLQTLMQPVISLRQQLSVAEQALRASQMEAELHGQADRVRVLEAAMVAAVRQLRRSALERGITNLPTLFTPTEDLRKIAYGAPV